MFDFLIAAVAVVGMGSFCAAMGQGVRIVSADPHYEYVRV